MKKLLVNKLEWVAKNPFLFLSWLLVVAVVFVGFYSYQLTERAQRVAYCSANKGKSECKDLLAEIQKNELEQKKLEESAAAERRKELENWVSSSGAEYYCEEALKQRLRDPNSYEREGGFTKDTPTDGYGKTLIWKFRAKNGFGGYNVSIGMCKATPDNGGSVEASIIGDN
jgi:hypothetical protein